MNDLERCLCSNFMTCPPDKASARDTDGASRQPIRRSQHQICPIHAQLSEHCGIPLGQSRDGLSHGKEKLGRCLTPSWG